MLEFDVKKISRVLTLSPARLGTCVGSDTSVYLCEVVDNGKGLNIPSSRVDDMTGLGEPVNC